MYSNERKNGFSILDLLVKIIFAGVFIFILIWLFNKKMPNVNMTPFYSNVFRENIKYMQEAGENYFTDDKMPSEVGESYKLTLSEMEAKNLLLPFVDQDGKACDKNASYVTITKLESGYELKTFLSCGKESNYTIKTLGCHTYCPTGNCNPEKSCTIAKITEYQYKKLVNGNKTKYSCAKGYTLKGKYCYKSKLLDSKSAIVSKTETTTIKKAAKIVQGEAKLTKLTTLSTTKKVEVSVIKNTTPSTTRTVKKAYDCSTTEKVRESYDCTKTKTETSCSTTYQQEAYSCNCKTTTSRGKNVTTCSTCYKSVPVQSCRDVQKTYTDTCYREVEKKTPKTCYKDVTETIPGTTTYKCPAGATSTGSGASMKCYKNQTTYSCPSGTDAQEGSGANLKCYKVTAGSISYTCEDSSYKLDGKSCVKTIKSTTTHKECKDKGYKLEGNKCNLYKTTKVKASAKTTKSSYYVYKWSEKTSLSGYTKTGKTRVVNGEEVCE